MIDKDVASQNTVVLDTACSITKRRFMGFKFPQVVHRH